MYKLIFLFLLSFSISACSSIGSSSDGTSKKPVKGQGEVTSILDVDGQGKEIGVEMASGEVVPVKVGPEENFAMGQKVYVDYKGKTAIIR